MASCPIKTVPDSRKDLISQLPADLKQRILQRLPTRDAARTALLSTHWKDVWLGVGRLAFDWDFFWGVKKCKGDSVVPFVKIITYILLHRVGPVKKFSLDISPLIACNLLDPNPEQSDLDQWFLFLSRNGVEELHIALPYRQYKLPFCMVLCPTIKQLRLRGFGFDWPTNAPCIFPGVTSLDFWHVDFNDNVNGIVYSIPNLEKLAFNYCQGISNLEINAPKLESLSVFGSTVEVESRWFMRHLKSIKTLCLSTILSSWEDVEVASFLTAMNLQVIKLCTSIFANEKQLMGVLQLLQKSPNLCELDIIAFIITFADDDIKAASRLLKDPDSCSINHDLKMLKTIKIEQFGGSTIEMHFVKMLLLKSPSLERVVIQESSYYMDASKVIKILRKLLCFPRASPKAQIVYMGKDYA